MNQARFSYAAAALHGKIYVAGGKGSVDSNLSSVECYDVEEDKWSEVCSMNHQRVDFALVASPGYLYAIGYHPTIERYDMQQNVWTVVCMRVCG